MTLVAASRFDGDVFTGFAFDNVWVPLYCRTFVSYSIDEIPLLYETIPATRRSDATLADKWGTSELLTIYEPAIRVSEHSTGLRDHVDLHPWYLLRVISRGP